MDEEVCVEERCVEKRDVASHKEMELCREIVKKERYFKMK